MCTAQGLIHSKTALGVLPAGTSNVWSKEFHLPGLTWHQMNALEIAVEKLVEGQVQTVDVGLLNGQAFMLWAGVGLDAEVVHQMESDREKVRQFSILKYAQTVLKNISSWEGIDLEIKIDSQKIEGRYIFAVVSNVRKYAGGMSEISPAACLDDGLMDLWLFDGKRPADSLRRHPLPAGGPGKGAALGEGGERHRGPRSAAAGDPHVAGRQRRRLPRPGSEQPYRRRGGIRRLRRPVLRDAQSDVRLVDGQSQAMTASWIEISCAPF